jgi:hypothetical protein
VLTRSHSCIVRLNTTHVCLPVPANVDVELEFGNMRYLVPEGDSTYVSGQATTCGDVLLLMTSYMDASRRVCCTAKKSTDARPGTIQTDLDYDADVLSTCHFTAVLRRSFCMQASSSGILNGLLIRSSMPASRAILTCSDLTFAVTAMTGTCPWMIP